MAPRRPLLFGGRKEGKLKVKLTKTAVESARPTGIEYELRDTIVPGLMLRVTRNGRKTFMLAYRTNAGVRRKPALGRVGEITVHQARRLAQDLLAEARRGRDPSAEKAASRAAPTVKQLCDRFIEDYSEPKNRPTTVKGYRGLIKRQIKPLLGTLKVRDVTRAHVADMMVKLRPTPRTANHALSCLRKMMNMAEVWGYRDDGTNPCRHVPKYPEGAHTRCLTDAEVGRIFAYLDQADREGLERPTIVLAIRLQFGFAARASEITGLRWDWIDFVSRRVVWPDSKTGSMSKPISGEAFDLLANAPRRPDAIYVIPALSDPSEPMSYYTYADGWTRVLKRARVPHVGTHGIRHRAATEIANSGVPIKVGMQLTAHKTVSQFMHYVHTEDEAVRAAAEKVARLRQQALGR
ncbi:MAG: tyrosine-type recombinase/integrase [Caulobacteraceae bacterium]